MLVYVRGAGDIATGVAARLVRAGVSVVMADIAVPTCIRRTISFCEAIRLGEVEVEGIRARLAQTPAEALEITEAGDVAWWWTPRHRCSASLSPRPWSTRFWPSATWAPRAIWRLPSSR